MPVKGNASSRTTSAIAAGTIDIRENPTQDISALSRDTENALNELGRIFDKKKIEEQQELAAVFGEEAFRLAHNMKDDGSGRKIAVHAIIGGIMSQITGAGFASGAVGAGLNEALIKNLKGKDPGTAQIVSAIIGAAAAKVAGGSAAAGASAAAAGTKWNFLYRWQERQMQEELSKAKTEEERQAIIERYEKIYQENEQERNAYAKYLADNTLRSDYGILKEVNRKYADIVEVVKGDSFELRRNNPINYNTEQTRFFPFYLADGLKDGLIMHGVGTIEGFRAIADDPFKVIKDVTETLGELFSSGELGNSLKDTLYEQLNILEDGDAYDKGFIVGAVLEEIAELAVPEAKISKLKYLTKGTKISSIVEIERGFDNFNRLKRQLGNPGEGMQWHHIVEQSQIKSYRAGFAPEQIHNVGNVIALPSGKGSIHSEISKIYSSKYLFTGDKTVRDWLATQSFEEQFKFGIQQLEKFGTVTLDHGHWVFKPFN